MPEEMDMKRSVAGCALALTVAVLVAPTQVEARRGSWYTAHVIGGMSANEILGGSYPYYGYLAAPANYGGPALMGPPPGCVIRQQRVWTGYRWTWRKLRICH